MQADEAEVLTRASRLPVLMCSNRTANIGYCFLPNNVLVPAIPWTLKQEFPFPMLPRIDDQTLLRREDSGISTKGLVQVYVKALGCVAKFLQTSLLTRTTHDHMKPHTLKCLKSHIDGIFAVGHKQQLWSH